MAANLVGIIEYRSSQTELAFLESSLCLGFGLALTFSSYTLPCSTK